MLEYKGYIAKVDFEEDDEYMHGEVINVRDVITFKGKNIKELKHELENSVEYYLDFCKRKNREPEKPFSGKFIVRVPSDLHRELYVAAKIHDVSLNKYISIALKNSLTGNLQMITEKMPKEETSRLISHDSYDITSSAVSPKTEYLGGNIYETRTTSHFVVSP